MFGNGKLVTTGARAPSDLEVALTKVTKELTGANLLQ
jgi:TATA-box binding protein (TBP) (component of TFIID and TFIIIB)